MVTAAVLTRRCALCKVFAVITTDDLIAKRGELMRGEIDAIRSVTCLRCGTELPAHPSNPRYWYGKPTDSWNPMKRIGARWHEELRPRAISIHRDIYDTWRWRCPMAHRIRRNSMGRGFLTWESCLQAVISHGKMQHNGRM